MTSAEYWIVSIFLITALALIAGGFYYLLGDSTIFDKDSLSYHEQLTLDTYMEMLKEGNTDGAIEFANGCSNPKLRERLYNEGKKAGLI
jgi:hypothetical protein